jgi:hypothetical protein
MLRRTSRWTAYRPEPFASEAALCEVLRSATSAAGWVFYPETGGWDAVLVLPDETQIGVQAKLRANVDVLAQAIVPARRVGPDVHAVLVPTCSRAFRDVAAELGIAVLRGAALRGDVRPGEILEQVVARAPRSTHLPGRCWLPPFVPDGPAGVPSPRSVSPWRIAAAKFCAELREGLRPTNEEIRTRGLSPSTWGNWLDPIEGTRPRRYAPRAGCALPDVAFPEVSLALGLPEPARPAA